MPINWSARSNAWANAILASDRLDDLLADLGCDLRRTSPAIYRGVCPLHGGDGKNFQLRTDGDTVPIYWRCYSGECTQKYKGSILGFVSGVLTLQRDKPVGLTQADRYLEAFLGGRPTGHQPRPAPRPRPEPPAMLRLTREQVRLALQIPAPYFLKRDFSAAVLDRHDVGYSARLKRSVVPIYDQTGQACVAFQARSELPYCPFCKDCHHQGSDCRFGQPKHFFSPKGGWRSAYLYNHAAAIRSPSPTVLVVEGPGDVWRAEEVGHTAVALLGSDLSRQQLEKLKALKKWVVLCLDRDRAGMTGMNRAYESLRQQRVRVSQIFVPAPHKDVGDMPREAAAAWLSSLLPG